MLGCSLITAKIYDLDKINGIVNYKLWDYIKVTGKMQVTTIDDIEMPYIEASNVELATK